MLANLPRTSSISRPLSPRADTSESPLIVLVLVDVLYYGQDVARRRRQLQLHKNHKYTNEEIELLVQQNSG